MPWFKAIQTFEMFELGRRRRALSGKAVPGRVTLSFTNRAPFGEVSFAGSVFMANSQTPVANHQRAVKSVVAFVPAQVAPFLDVHWTGVGHVAWLVAIVAFY
eukprot:CAMPEP_0202435182 /NCGR_PEP_ID=MMETSP1345-20130828/18236_1 /ASSEMBLY_ACC=CAM_ASM_000843 /TAXON_ID=342563 /ORGANISM="Fabrea Fabrea salina" /LENGTH=101 /DNA_ID=CAMNT_0049048117 /DNA_START=961 /DNA_END=1266 /DNA_ORIENTATION=+